MKLKGLIKKFIDNEDGISLIEFAFLLPVMLVLLIGTVEVSNILRIDRKVTQAAHTAVDLIGQASSINDAEFADILVAVELSVFPYAENNLSLGVSSVEFDITDGTASVGWTESLRGGVVDNAIAQTVDLEVAGYSVVVAKAGYSYQPLFNNFLFDGFEIEETAYGRPRNSLVVVRE